MLRTRTVVVAMGVLILPMCARLAAGQDDDPCGAAAVATFNELRLKHGASSLVDDAKLSKAAHKLAMDAALNPNSMATYPRCLKTIKTGDTPGSIVFNCDSGTAPDGNCAQYDSNDYACTDAVNQWTSYKWVFSETPLEDNMQGMEFGQIVYSKATKAGCAVAKSERAGCVYFICLFDVPLERSNEALKKHVKREGAKPEPDQHEWCSVFASGEAKKLCSEAQIQCSGGNIAKCCPTSCFAPSD